MDSVYNKWFGPNAEIFEILTYLAYGILGVVAAVSLLAAAWLRFHDYKLAIEEEGEKALTIKKKYKKCFWTGIACGIFPVVWPLLLLILDAAGVGKIVEGDFLPSSFIELVKGSVWESLVV